MNKIKRIAALGAAVCIVGAVMAGCGSSEKYDEQFAVISESSEKALAVTCAEIEIDENIEAGKVIEGVLENRTSYTYIQYTKGDSLEYTLKTEDGNSSYERFTSPQGVFEIVDGDIALYSGEAPDFGSYIDIDFTLEDIKAVSVEYGDKGTKLYTVTMKPSYADKFDSTENGGEYDCRAVTYIYKIDSLTRLKSVITEYSAKFTYNGEAQDTKRTVSVNFAEMNR